VFAASAASRAKCSLRAASRNVHQTGIDRWPGRSILPSGSRPASQAISRARSWYGSDRSMPCTWLLPPADATLRARRFRNEPVGQGVLSSLSPPCQLFLLSRPRVGTRTRRRDCLSNGQYGQQKIGLVLPAGVKRVRAGKQFGRTIGRV